MAGKILVRYGELALKGRNRGQFEQQLQENIFAAVKEYGATVNKMHGRFLVSGPAEHVERIAHNLSAIFGIVSVSPVEVTELTLESIKNAAAGAAAEKTGTGVSFAIQTRRANKNFQYSSMDLNRLLGSHLQQIFPGLRVDLNNPSFTLFVEIGYDKAYLYSEHISGPGGLPLGISGKGLLLLSGGIDSPVAGWLSMKRGLALEALHFHSFPFTGHHSREKAVEICRILSRSSELLTLHMVNVIEIQKELRAKCPERLGVILLRRMMLRLAEQLSKRQELQALVTGESLGQVASQTLESMAVIEKATNMLILRPLVGMDKKEIVDRAVKIGTYETSILPYEDCCTLFLPSNPVTKPKLGVIEEAEKALDLNTLLKITLDTLTTKNINKG